MKKPSYTRTRLVVAVAALCAAAAVLLLLGEQGGMTQSVVGENGEVVAQLPVEEGSRFSVTFKHSVNQSDVREIYEISDGRIFVEACEYAAFGAGVATEIEEGQTLSYTEDGKMLIEGIHREIPRLCYMVGRKNDHYLEFEGRRLNITDLYGEIGTLTFTLTH